MSDYLPDEVRGKMMSGTVLAHLYLQKADIERFPPKALGKGRYELTPQVLVMEMKGLEGIPRESIC